MTRKILFSYFLVILVLVAAFVVVSVTKAGDCTDTYCDSDISIIRTMSPDYISCSYSEGSNVILVSWSPQNSTPTIEMYNDAIHPPVIIPIYPKGTNGNNCISTASNACSYQFTSGGSYTFILNNGTNNVASTTCSVTLLQPAKDDRPTMLQAFAYSSSSIFLNWKDNATTSANNYSFNIQRMQITPATVTLVSLTPQQTSNNQPNIDLGWKYNGDPSLLPPYQILVERIATTTDYIKNRCGSQKFHCDGSDENAIKRIFSAITSSTTGTITDYNNLNEATTYYYRIRACSSIYMSYYASSTNNPALQLNEGEDSKPSRVCSFPTDFSPVTTPPNAPSDLTAYTTGSTVNLAWKNNSTHWQNNSNSSVFFEIYRDTPTNPSSFSFIASTTATSTTDTISTSGTYHYKVSACIINNSGNKVCSMDSNLVPVTIQVSSASYNLISNLKTNLMASIISPVSSFVSPLVDVSKNVLKDFFEQMSYILKKVSMVVADSFNTFKKVVISLIAPMQTRGDTINYDSYFKDVTTITQPFFEDTGLSPNTVYVYRVRVHYNDGRRDSDWSNWAAAKTLFDTGGNPPQGSTVCVANSVCRTFNAFQSSDLSNYNFNPTTEKSENQCKVNADCVNVGRINVLIKEK